MTEHDFRELFEHYPALIQDMNDTFTSHQFILHLARQHQSLYIEALSDYNNLLNPRHSAPFKTVHGILAKHLNVYPNLVTHIGDVESRNIFKKENTCAQWRKA